jgi:tetratricopeptide (TPR) repeat protein
MTRIILCMIVKNESRIIQRVMSSALPIIDAYSICDTGSTDDTNVKIREFATVNNIPGDIHDVPWQNFGYNRNESFIRARETATRLGFSHEETYALFLDGDHILKFNPGFDKNSLKLGGYQIPQVEYSIRYYNTRFARLSNNWKCIGVTHEYWSMEEPGFAMHRIDNPWIEDKADGGCKSDKFERDISLLTKGLEQDPGNVRYMFYLAQSYKDNNQPEESIKWYTNRINAGGWEEEVYYSMLQIGRIYSGMKKLDQISYWYLKAYNYRPIRNESLVELAFAYKDAGQYTTALMFAKKAVDIVFPVNDVLFVNYKFYNETPNHLILELGPKANQPLDSIESANSLVLVKNTSDDVLKDALRILSGISIKLTVPTVRFMEPNREILYTRVKCRGKNGTSIRNGVPTILRDISEDRFNFSEVVELRKLDTIKIVEFEKFGRVAIAKVIHKNELCGAIIKFNQQDILEKCEILKISKGAFMPFYYNGKLAVLQNINPLTVLVLDENANVTSNIGGEIPFNIDDNTEVTSSIIEYNNQYMFALRWMNNDICLQRLISMSKNLKSMQISLPFVTANKTDRITSFLIGDDEMTFYVDSEDSESIIMKMPNDLLTKIFKNKI